MTELIVPKNPFAMVYSTLWDMILEHPGFARDVKEGNRIMLNDQRNRDPLKTEIADADMPEVMLVSTSIQPNLFNTSNTSMCVRNYAWMIHTGDFRYYIDEKTPMLATIEWYVFVAMHAWKQRLGALRWRDKAFVKRANITSGRDGLQDKAQGRNIRGWSAVWDVDVEMHFDTRDLMAELPEIAALPPLNP